MRLFLLATGLSLGALGGAPGEGRASAADGLYTAAQAGAGEKLYVDQCVSCHGTMQAFVPEMAALLGDHTFRNRWEGRPLGEMYVTIINAMPQDAPGTLSPEETASLIAYILSSNRFPAGDTALPSDVDALNGIPFAR